ncbi:MAG TPA: AAA family ATPase [Armatimonadota bacterium]|jgi:predicted ATPase
MVKQRKSTPEANSVRRLEIHGFRRLASLSLEMRPLMTLIGANGVGKTSLLDAVMLLSASAQTELNQALSTHGGLPSLLTRRGDDDLSLQAEMPVPGHKPLRYQLRLAPQGPGYRIAAESLTQEREGRHGDPFKHIDSVNTRVRYFDIQSKDLIEPTWSHDPLETTLSQVPRMFGEPESLRKALSSVTLYHALDVGPRAPVKLPQAMRPATHPGANGEDLVTYLYYLRESDRSRFESIEDSLHAAYSDFEELSFPPVAAGMLTMTWRSRGFTKPFYAHELSEGTLRFLWLVSLLQSPALPTITMIDEPEVSLHPELLSLLADLLREASARTQLIVATHSDRLIRFLNPDEVAVMDMDEGGGASAVWADSLDLDSWLAEYSLDEVWRMGRMGGRA